MINKRPPLGVMPEWLWNEYRIASLLGAILRHLEAQASIPVEWVAEYNRILELKNTREAGLYEFK